MRNFYRELADYTNRDPVLVEQRCVYAYIELAWQWPRYTEDPLSFYRDTDLYLFDLTQLQTQLQTEGVHRRLRLLFENSPHIKKVLDYGGGIGEYSIIAAEAGLDVSFLEVEGSKTMDYAKYRFAQYRVCPKILTEKDPLDTYDLVIARDVFEHLPDPQKALQYVSEKTKYLICDIDTLPFNVFYPQHISHPDPSEYFERSIVDPDMWMTRSRA